MSDTTDGIMGIVLLGLLIGLILFVGAGIGSDISHRAWAECRTLLTTADSATVLRVKPACADWTWPQPREKP